MNPSSLQHALVTAINSDRARAARKRRRRLI
jgi:hypothetical protein